MKNMNLVKVLKFQRCTSNHTELQVVLHKIVTLLKDSITEDKVWWESKYSICMLHFDALYKKLPAIYPIRIYVRDSYVCADPTVKYSWLQKLHGQTCFAIICFTIRTR
jgi:hypothetical protein